MRRRSHRLAIISGLAALTYLALSTTVAIATMPAPDASWSFDEAQGPTVVDTVGGLDGTIMGAVTRIPDGVSGAALRFSGGSVAIPEGVALTTPDLTVSLWIRAASAPADGAVIAERGTIGCDVGAWALVVDAGHVKLAYRDAAYGQPTTLRMTDNPALPSLWDGVWHHVAITVKADAGGYGWVGFWAEDWSFGKFDTGVRETALETADLSIGGPAGGCTGVTFAGDVDDVRVYPTEVWPADLASMEPTVARTMSIEVASGGSPIGAGSVDVKLLPVPAVAGVVRVFTVSPGGVATQTGVFAVDAAWNLPSDGTFRVAFQPLHAGVNQVRVRFDPAWGDPLEAATTVDVAQASSTASIRGNATPIDATDPLELAGLAQTASKSFKPTGTIAFDALADGTPSEVGTCQLADVVGSEFAGCQVELAPRPAGDYHFRIRYLGDADVAGSSSPAIDVSVLPAVEPGPVTIDDGAATTDHPVVTVSTPATGATTMSWTINPDDPAVRTDGPYAPSTTAWLTAPGPVYDNDGHKTIWVRYANAANHVTAWVSDAIFLDRGIQKGTVSINGGAAATGSRDVTLSVPVANPGAVSSVEISNDGVTWDRRGVTAGTDWFSAQPWTLAGSGTQTVMVRWRDLAGHGSLPVTSSTVVSPPPPPPIAPAASITALPGLLATNAWPVRWSAVPGTRPVASHDVRYRRAAWNGSFGGYATWLSATAATGARFTGSPGSTYCFSARARDTLGLVSPWTAETCTAVPLDDRSLRRYGSWAAGTSSSYFRSTYLRSYSYGSRLVRTGVVARQIGLLATTCRTCGSVRVYWGSTLLRTVSLYSPTTQYRRPLIVTTFAAARSGTLTIVVSSSGRAVVIDGVAIRR